jgi:hypothetical protein
VKYYLVFQVEFSEVSGPMLHLIEEIQSTSARRALTKWQVNNGNETQVIVLPVLGQVSQAFEYEGE